MKKFIIIAVVLIVAVAAFLLTRGGDAQTIQSVAKVEPGHIVVTLTQTGIIKPQVGAMIAVGARYTGLLEMLKVKVGDNVTKGELIAQIDSRSIVESIRQSRNSLSKAQVDLERTQKLFPVDKAMQINTIESAKSNYEYLQDVYNRELALYEKGYSRKETLDKTKHDSISAQTEYERQKLRLDYIQAEYEAAVITLKSEIARQKSVLEEQEIQLSYTKIYAPINGVVSAVNSVQGETIVAGLEVANLITVFRPELLEMYVYVDESDIGKVNVGMPVKYTVDTYPGREFTGEISRINLQSEALDGVVYYIAIVAITPEDALALRPEMTTSVKILAQEKDVPLSVPSAAIKWEGGSQIAYKVLNQAENETEKVNVTVGLRGENNVEIIEGLVADDTVVVRFGTPNMAKMGGMGK